MFTCKAVIQYVFLKFVIRFIKLLKEEWLRQFSGVIEVNRSLWQHRRTEMAVSQVGVEETF